MKRRKPQKQSDSLLANNDILRPNYKPVTTPNDLVFGASLDFGAYYARSGNVYEVTTGSQSVASNGFLVIQVTNPANSGKNMYITRLSGGATTNTTIDIFKNSTFAAAGTSMTPRNTNWSFSDTSPITGKFLSQATDPTTGGTSIMSIIQTGGPVVLDFDARYIIPSSSSARQIYIRLVNNTNQTNLLSINLSWWEI